MKEAALGALQEQLRGAGLRATAPRVAVLRQLERAGAPQSHAEVWEALSGQGFDRATVYRNLTDLTEAGLVRRSDVGDHVWRFERVRLAGAHDDDHAHFVCSECGTVECLPGDAVQVKPVRGAPRRLAVERVQIQVRGVCNDCD